MQVKFYSKDFFNGCDCFNDLHRNTVTTKTVAATVMLKHRVFWVLIIHLIFLGIYFSDSKGLYNLENWTLKFK